MFEKDRWARVGLHVGLHVHITNRVHVYKHDSVYTNVAPIAKLGAHKWKKITEVYNTT